MMAISDLPRDLVGEIFSRVPLTSLSIVRLTCRTWNAFSKKHILGKKVARKNEFLEFMVIDSRVCSLRFDLQGILNEEDLVDPSMKHISKPNIQVQFSKVFHCDGLLLCVTTDHSRLLVCNPYLGQIIWIPPRINELDKFNNYALGYDNNNRNHKIMRIFCDDKNIKGIDLYDFSSGSWRVLDVNPEADDIWFWLGGVSLKGNTYFFGQEVTTEDEIRNGGTDIEDYLICFEFTTERFGPRLPLPFHPEFPHLDTITLSWARDEKLAVLYSHYDTYEIYEIWITTKIDPNAVSWNPFLTLDLRLINDLPNHFSNYFGARSFFIDEEKKVAVLFDIDKYNTPEPCRYQMAYIVGEDGYFKFVNMGEALNRLASGELVCSSYVPSLVQLNN